MFIAEKVEAEEDQQLMEVKEEVSALQGSILDQQDPELHIKKEEGELWISQDKMQLVKSEDDENPQVFQLHQIKTEDNREAEPPTSSSADQINTEPDGEACGGPEPDMNPGPYTPSQPTTNKAPDSSETEVSEDEDEDDDLDECLSGSESEDGDENWRETRTLRSGGKHNTRHETSKKSFSCPKCFKLYVNKRSFEKHVNSHSDTRQFTCDLCGKTFKTRYDNKIHMRFHTGEKPHVCKECGKAFCFKSSLKVHMATHTGEKPFQCEVCDNKFAHKASLKSHMTIHKGERPFACSKCDKRFRLKGDLTMHEFVHFEVKPFGCGECGARFTRKETLRVHSRLHTGERPFSCECGQKFIRMTHLRQHMKRKESLHKKCTLVKYVEKNVT